MQSTGVRSSRQVLRGWPGQGASVMPRPWARVWISIHRSRYAMAARLDRLVRTNGTPRAGDASIATDARNRGAQDSSVVSSEVLGDIAVGALATIDHRKKAEELTGRLCTFVDVGHELLEGANRDSRRHDRRQVQLRGAERVVVLEADAGRTVEGDRVIRLGGGLKAAADPLSWLRAALRERRSWPSAKEARQPG